MSEKSSSSGGAGCFGYPLVVFVTLKLTDLIDWSWWWVLSPIWIYLLLVAFVLCVAVVVAMLDD